MKIEFSEDGKEIIIRLPADTVFPAFLASLTRRQRDFLQAFAGGRSTKEIARSENVSIGTVKERNRQLRRKFQLARLLNQ